MMRSRIGLSVLTGVVMTCCGAAQADVVPVLLDEGHQGKGNKGFEYRPLDAAGFLADFVLTAMSSIDDSMPLDPFASGLAGTVYVEKGNMGTGVQTGDKKGSKLISGGGAHNDEQLVFTFDDDAPASSIRLTLSEFEAGNGLNDGDDPILFILFSNLQVQTLTEVEFMDAYYSTGSKQGYIDFSMLSLNGGSVSSLWVRETNGHLGVNGLAHAAAVVPLPPAVFAGLAGLGLVGIARRRRLA